MVLVAEVVVRYNAAVVEPMVGLHVVVVLAVVELKTLVAEGKLAERFAGLGVVR